MRIEVNNILNFWYDMLVNFNFALLCLFYRRFEKGKGFCLCLSSLVGLNRFLKKEQVDIEWLDRVTWILPLGTKSNVRTRGRLRHSPRGYPFSWRIWISPIGSSQGSSPSSLAFGVLKPHCGFSHHLTSSKSSKSTWSIDDCRHKTMSTSRRLWPSIHNRLSCPLFRRDSCVCSFTNDRQDVSLGRGFPSGHWEPFVHANWLLHSVWDLYSYCSDSVSRDDRFLLLEDI